MFAMGLKVFIAGKIGGLIMTDDDLHIQHSTNMNGRLVTFSDEIGECLANLNKSKTGFSVDIRNVDHTNGVKYDTGTEHAGIAAPDRGIGAYQ